MRGGVAVEERGRREEMIEEGRRGGGTPRKG